MAAASPSSRRRPPPPATRAESTDHRREEMAELALGLADGFSQDHAGEPLDGGPRADEGERHDRAAQQHDHEGEVAQQALVDGHRADHDALLGRHGGSPGLGRQRGWTRNRGRAKGGARGSGRESARRQRTRSSSASMPSGLARTTAAVVCRNSESVGLSPYPVMKTTTGRGAPSCATARKTAFPSTSGIRTSQTTRSYTIRVSRSRAAWPL